MSQLTNRARPKCVTQDGTTRWSPEFHFSLAGLSQDAYWFLKFRVWRLTQALFAKGSLRTLRPKRSGDSTRYSLQLPSTNGEQLFLPHRTGLAAAVNWVLCNISFTKQAKLSPTIHIAARHLDWINNGNQSTIQGLVRVTNQRGMLYR